MDENGRKYKILFIEDDVTVALLYKMRMEAEGFTVKHFPEADKALESLKEFRPDLIVCDLMLPKINGFDLIDILRNTLKNVDPKIVVMSALSTPADMERAMKMGADDYIIKSEVLINDVMNRFRKLLNLPPSTIA